MSKETEQIENLAGMYEQLHNAPVGQHLIKWLQATADQTRRSASNFAPAIAYSELRFADALESVVNMIETNRRAKDIGKRH